MSKMLYSNPENDWVHWSLDSEHKLAIFTKKGQAMNVQRGTFYVCKKTHQIIGGFPKANYAKGRIMLVMSNIPSVPSGEYVILDKEGFSYMIHDTLHLKRHVPVLDTPRKAHNWAEKQIAYQEAMDGLTTEEIVAKMGVL